MQKLDYIVCTQKQIEGFDCSNYKITDKTNKTTSSQVAEVKETKLLELQKLAKSEQVELSKYLDEVDQMDRRIGEYLSQDSMRTKFRNGVSALNQALERQRGSFLGFAFQRLALHLNFFPRVAPAGGGRAMGFKALENQVGGFVFTGMFEIEGRRTRGGSFDTHAIEGRTIYLSEAAALMRMRLRLCVRRDFASGGGQGTQFVGCWDGQHVLCLEQSLTSWPK